MRRKDETMKGGSMAAFEAARNIEDVTDGLPDPEVEVGYHPVSYESDLSDAALKDAIQVGMWLLRDFKGKEMSEGLAIERLLLAAETLRQVRADMEIKEPEITYREVVAEVKKTYWREKALLEAMQAIRDESVKVLHRR